MDVGSRDTIPPSEHGFAGLVFAGDKDLKPAYAPLYLRSEESILNSIRLKKEQLVLDHEFDRIIGSSRPLTEVLDLVTKLENLAKAAKTRMSDFLPVSIFPGLCEWPTACPERRRAVHRTGKTDVGHRWLAGLNALAMARILSPFVSAAESNTSRQCRRCSPRNAARWPSIRGT